MVNRVQTLRSSVPGQRPAGRLPGELYVNWPDSQLGVINEINQPVDLVAVRYFSPLTSYAIGDIVVQAGEIWTALVAVAPGPFNPAQWNPNLMRSDAGGILAGYLPLTGGTLTGLLTLPSNSQVVINGAPGSQRSIVGMTAGVTRWIMMLGDQAADLTGSNFALWNANNVGSLTTPAFQINRLTAAATFSGALNGAAATFSGLLNGTSATFTGPIAGTTETLSGTLNGADADFTGPVTLAADPVLPLEAATKQYVDSARWGDNRIINGDMRIDQRNSGVGGTAAGYTADRWQYQSSSGNRGAWQRAPNGAPGIALGLSYALAFTSSSAYTVAAGDTTYFTQPIEADMITDFAWGTPNAQLVTLSFWVFSSVVGTFSGSIRNYPTPSTRSYPFIFSVAAPNTWEKVIITIPGNTAGAWVMSGNAAAMALVFDLGCGATFRGPAGAWAAGNFLGATGSTSIVATNGGLINFAGVKLEIGSHATPFNRQSLAKSMADCQRYYNVFLGLNYAIPYGNPGALFRTSLVFPTRMRTGPTGTLSNISYSNAVTLNLSAANASDVNINFNVGGTVGQSAASFDTTLSAEL